MPAPYSAGSIFVSVVPSFKDNQRDIAREYQRRGEEASKSFSEGFDKQIARDLPKAMENAAKASKPAQKDAGADAGKQYSSAFRKTLVEGLKSAEKDLERAIGPNGEIKVPVDADATKFRNEFNALVRDIRLTRADLEVGADVGQAIFDVDRLNAKLDSLRNRTIDVDTRSNLTGAQGALDTAATRARQQANLNPQEPDQQPQRDLGAFNKGLASRLQSSLSALPPIPVDADVTPAKAKIIEFRTDAFQLLDDIEADVHLDGDDTLARARALMGLLEGVIETADPEVEIDSSFNAAGALAQIKTWAEAVDPIEVPVEPELGAFRTLVVRQLKEAAASLPELPVGLDGTEIQRDMAQIRTELTDLAESVKVGMDMEEFRAKSRELQARLAELRRVNIDVDVDVDSAHAIASLEKIDASARDADNSLRRSGRGADDGANSFRAFSGVILGIAAIGPAAIPVIGAIGATAAATGPLALAGAAGLGVFALGIMGIGDAVKAMGAVQTNAAKDAKAYADGVRNATRAVDSAEQALASAQRARDGQAKDSERSIRNGVRAVADARETAAEAGVRAEKNVQRALRGVEDAQKALTAAERAAEQSKRGLTEANKNAERAEGDFADAQRDAERAQENLTEAREDAADRIMDLRDQIRGGALDERRAIMQLAEAEVAYANAMADPGATRTEREQLLLSLDEQRFRLDQVRKSNSQLAEEQAKAVTQGIEGSDEVVAAQENIVTANERVVDAQDKIVTANAAVVDANQAIVDANDRVVEAQQGVADANATVAEAQAEQQKTARDGAQAIADAEESLQDTRADAADAAVKANEAVQAAQERVADAQADYADALAKTSTSQDKLAESMAKLSPAGREFAEYLFSLKPYFSELQEAAAGGLLPGLQDWMQSIIGTYGPQFKDIISGMSGALGDMFRGFGDALQSDTWHDFFDMLESKGPVFIGQIGDVLTSLGNGVADLLVAFAPSAENFGNDLVGAAGAFEKWAAGLKDTEGFAQFIEWWDRVGPEVVEFFKQLGDAVAQIGIALAPYGEDLLNFFTGVLDFVSETDTDKIAAIALSIVGLFVAFQLLVGLNALISGFATVVGLGSAAMALFNGTAVGTLAIVSGIAGIVALAVAALAILGVGFYLLWTNSETFRDIVKASWQAIQDAAGAVADWFMDHIWPIMQQVWQAIADGATWLWETILKPIFEVWQIAFGVLWDFMVAMWEKVGYPLIQLIWTIFQELWQIVEPLLQLIGIAFQLLWSLVTTLWDTIGKPMFDAFINIVTFLWEKVIDPVLQFIAGAFGWLFGIIKSTWETVGKPVFDLVQSVVEALVGVFQGSFDGIKGIWDALLEVFKAPIKFLIETVLNKGLIDGINGIAGIFGKDDWIPHIPTGWMGEAPSSSGGNRGAVGAFATGGKIPGNSPTKRADNIPIMATAGEFMHQVDAVNYYGVDVMRALNERRIPREVLGLATGGLVAFGRRLQGMGARVAEHPEFPPLDMQGHGKTSLHYTGHAIDVNTRAGTSALEQAELRPMQQLAESLGFRTIFMAPDHYNHLHVDDGGGSSIGNAIGNIVGGAADFLSNPIGTLKKMVTDAAGTTLDNPIGKLLLKIPFGVADMAKDKLVSMASGVGDFFGDAAKTTAGWLGIGSGNSDAKGQVRSVANRYGWGSGDQWNALEQLVQGESGWNPNAANGTSSARGLFQKMTSLHGPIEPTAAGQAEWGLDYIKDAYGDPVNAWRKWNSRSPHWYADGGPITDDAVAALVHATGITPTLHDQGGTIDPGWNLIHNATRKPEASLNPTQLDNIQTIADGGRGPLIGELTLPLMTHATPEAIAGEILFQVDAADLGGKYT